MSYLSTQNYLDYYSNSFAVQPVTVNLPNSADTYLSQATATTNFDTSVVLSIGDNAGGTAIRRAWIKSDFSAIPAGRRFVSAVLNLNPDADGSSNARTMSAHRCLRAVVSNQATWNIFSTGNNWGTAGASNSSTDYDGATALGTMAVSASPTIDVFLQMTFTAAGVAEYQKLYDGTYTNNGIILFVATQNTDRINYDSQDSTTANLRPFITVTYVL